MKHLILLLFMSLTVVSFSQVLLNGQTSSTASSTSAFFSASGAQFSSGNGFGTDGSGNLGKGLIFPRTDLTSFTFTALAPVDFPTVADGMIVYNNGTGNTPAPIAFGANSGIGNQAVNPGFYYFSNPGSTFDTSAGQWLPMGGGSSSAVAIADGVASDSYATINATQEKVVRLTSIMADGTNTTLNLDAALTSAGVTVAKFRKAAIYNASGDLVMQATGGYTTGTDILVTGNGMMNKLLPVGPYSVEVYFTE
jgi:hypothetical protein